MGAHAGLLVELYSKKSRRRGEKSGKEDGQAGGGKQKLRPAILDEEELAKTGMGAVLNMARRKGFLDQKEETKKDMGLKDLICKDYKIDDKSRIKRRMTGRGGEAEIEVLMVQQALSLRRRITS